MDTDLALTAVSMQAARTQGLAQIAIVKKQHEMELSLIQMIDEVARSAPPPGQGTRVDKIA